MNNIRYIDNQSKIDLFFIKLSDKINQLLIGQNMPNNYLGYIIWLHKLNTNVFVANQ